MGFGTPRARAWLALAAILGCAAFVFAAVAVDAAYVKPDGAIAASCTRGVSGDCVDGEPGTGPAWLPWLVASTLALVGAIGALMRGRRAGRAA